MSLELDTLMDAADQHHRQNYRSDVEPDEPDYSQGIPIAEDVRTGKKIKIKPGGTRRMAAFGPSGSMKTTLAKAFLSRSVERGYKVAHLSDVKNDFQHVNHYGGVSNKLRQKYTAGLIPGESPKEQERILAVPNFMTKHYKSHPRSYSTIFSLSLSDLSESEFKFILGYYDWSSSAARETLDEFLMEKELHETSLTELLSRAQEREQSTLVRKLKTFKGKRIISNRVENSLKDVLAELEDKKIFSLGLKGWRKHLGGQEHYFQFYSAKAHRVLLELIEDDVIKSSRTDPRVIVFNDEFHKICPQGDENNQAKQAFQQVYDIDGRQAGVTTFVAAQRSSQLPNNENDDDLDFITDLTDVFLMRGRNTLSENDWKPVVKAMGVYDGRGGKQLDKWKAKINSLERGQGIYISSEKHSSPSDCPSVQPLAPLHAHPG